MGDQNYGGPAQPGEWTPVQGQGNAPAPASYAAGSAQYPPPPPPAGYASGAGYPPPPPVQNPYGQPGYGAPPVAVQGLSPNIAGLLCYLLFIPAIIFLVLDPYKRDPFIRFHAWQELILACTAVVFSFASIPLALIFSVIHLGGIMFFIEMVFSLALGVCAIIAMIKAATGSTWKIPVIGDLAANFAAKQAL